MRIIIYASTNKKFDSSIAECLNEGRGRHKITIAPTSSWKGEAEKRYDLAVVVGVKGHSGPIFKAYRDIGKHAVFIDKGYTRLRGGPVGTLYWRVSIDSFQPLPYFQKRPRPDDRWGKLGIEIKPRQEGGEAILFAGSSQKYCDWFQLGSATRYADYVLKAIRERSSRPIIYRPKPSWADAVPIEGYEYSPDTDKFVTRLEQAHCLVTFGSNACFEALISGVPSVVLGEGITKPVSSTTVKEVDNPKFPDASVVYQLACDLAYCQYSLKEMFKGVCWQHVEEVIHELG